MPAKSEKQRRFFGLVLSVKRGKSKAPNKKVAEVAKSMSEEDIRDFATKRKKSRKGK